MITAILLWPGLFPPDLPTGHSVDYYFDKAGNRQQVTDSANPH